MSAMRTSTANSYLAGNFAPVRDELTVFDLPVAGTIPPELNGRLLRNGPNPITDPDPMMYHWFVGDGMLHGIELRAGRAVSYRNRWIRTDRACELLGEQPPHDQPPPVFAPGSVANTSVIHHAGRILALVEVCLPTRMTRELTTIGRFDFDGRLTSAMTAHPKEDPETGELLFFGYNPFAKPYLRFHVADADGNLVRSEDIDIPGPTMAHDFAITRKHVIFLDLPVVFDLTRLVGSRPFPAAWDPSYGARVGVMPREGGNADIRWYDIDPCYVFHTLNAYELDGTIVVDVVRYDKMFDTDLHGPAEANPTLDRWTIDQSAGTLRSERIDDRGQEFPVVDDRLVGLPNRYGYATLIDVHTERFDPLGGIVKHDLMRGTSERLDFGPGTASSEPIFVPCGDAEDDGYLLAVVYDGTRDGSDLVILHAQDFGGGPLAVVTLPRRVPYGFHGCWVPDGV